MKTIISIDGGGAKGAAESEMLFSLERRVGRRLHECVDLFIGSSAGAILGAIYANGSLSAEQANETFQGALPRVFAKRFRWPNTPKYSRQPVRDAFKCALGDPLMRDCKTKLVTTSVNACDSRTHYFKSYEDKDGAIPLIDAVERSFAAPLFFGGIVDQNASALWLDGGSGSDNCPVLQAVFEATLQGWFADGEEIHLLSIGGGWSTDDMPWSDAEHAGNLREVMYFMDPEDGGLARRQATDEKVNFLNAIAHIYPGFSFQRVDFPLTKHQNAMDRIEFLPLYRCSGIKAGATIDERPFVRRLSEK